MGVVGDGTVVAPFANAAMRLLREDWKGKYGSKMLSEELYPILQTGIPQPDQTFQNFVTINASDTGQFAAFIDKFGNKIFQIDGGGLEPVEPPGYPPPKLRPRIVWGAHTINTGDAIGPTELDAVAQDPETFATITGSFVYTPPSGTTFSTAGKSTIYVDFTPDDGVKYRRAKGSTVLTIQGPLVKKTPDINWLVPAAIWKGTSLSGTQLNATATDPDSPFGPVAGSFVYTPPAGTFLDVGDDFLHVDFTPTDTAAWNSNNVDNTILVKGITRIGGGFGSIAVQAGDVVVVGAGYSGTAGDVTVSINDGGNSYTQIGGYVRTNVGGAHRSTSLWYAVVGSSGSITVTVTPAGTSPSAIKTGINVFRGVLALDSTSNASGTGGETQTAGTCTVSADRELIVTFTVNEGTGFAMKPAWATFTGAYSNAYGNVGTTDGGPTPTAPEGGANASIDPVLSGTATGQWAIIAASFTHRTS